MSSFGAPTVRRVPAPGVARVPSAGTSSANSITGAAKPALVVLDGPSSAAAAAATATTPGQAPLELVGELLSCIMSKSFERALLLCKEVLAYEPHNITVKQFLPVIREALDLHIGDDDDDESDEDDNDEDEIDEEVPDEDGVVRNNDDDEEDDDDDDEDDEDESDSDDANGGDENPDFQPSGVLYRQGMSNLVVGAEKAMAALALDPTKKK